MCYLCQSVSSHSSAANLLSNNLIAHTLTAQNGIVAQFVGSVPNTGNPLTDGLASWTRQLPIGQPVNIKYTFEHPANCPFYNYGPPSAFNATQRANTLIAMDKFAEVANITWTEDNSSWNLDFSLEILDNTPNDGGVRGVTWFGYNAQALMSNPVHIAMEPNAPGMGNFVPGSGFGWYALIHEIGHAMGMKHPFDVEDNYNLPPGTDTDPQTPVYMQNAGWTVMSYADGTEIARSEVRGLMPGDIQAMQLLYGANMNTGAGDTTYDLSSAAYAGARGLWDASGNDTFTSLNATAPVTIDLRNDVGNASGLHYSKVTHGGGVSKIIISGGAVIENAIAGNFGDTVIGNDAANYLYGGAGNDTIKGAAGNDAIFGGNDLVDTSGASNNSDVLAGGTGNDIIFGGQGNDTLYGGDDVTSFSNSGADTLFGGLGDDLIYGHDGNDIIIGAGGSDTLYGGLGNDVYGIGWGNYLDYVMQFEGKGVAGGDVLRILDNVNNSGIHTAADVLAHITTDGTHSFLNLGGNNGVFLAFTVPGTGPGQLGAGDIEVVSQLV